ncbi:MAG: flagellin [Bryobacteraceae bacterium]|jgi:flagellin
MISFQTNIDSLVAQQNLNTNSMFQSNTIQQLTSGYRINSSGDDAAGLAVANQDADSIAQITQGVANGNDGTALLQTMDGGMSNISQILDRLQTLSTQSASSSFTGDRATLNAEFQTDIGELNRQAQAIGLNTGGTYAQSLNIYLGGGGGTSASYASATADGQVAVNLSNSAVDAKALGLSGLQVVAGTTDISTGSSTHSVDQIVTNSANATATAGYTTFYVSGPGFSDNSKVAVSVNLSGVSDTNTLVTAINNAITTAANGTSPAAQALQTAGITASVNTDSNNGQELAFSSATSAFQVEAGDQMANALMGNLSSGSTGVAVATTVTGAATAATGTTFAPTGVTVQISGAGLAGPVNLTFATADNTVNSAISDLQTQVQNSTALKAAGITVTGAAGSPLVFTSATGETLNVQSTGDTQNVLGLGALDTSASVSSPAFYSTITGAAPSTGNGLTTLGFSLNGGATGGGTAATIAGTAPSGITAGATVNTSALTTLALNVNGTAVSVNMANDANNGATETLANVVKYINSQVDAKMGWGNSVSVAAITPLTSGAASTITLTSPTANLDSSLAVTTSATATALGLTGTNTGTGALGNTIALNLAGGDATSAAYTSGSVAAANVNTSVANAALNFSIDGQAVVANFANDANSAGTAAALVGGALGAAATVNTAKLETTAAIYSGGAIGANANTGALQAQAAVYTGAGVAGDSFAAIGAGGGITINGQAVNDADSPTTLEGVMNDINNNTPALSGVVTASIVTNNGIESLKLTSVATGGAASIDVVDSADAEAAGLTVSGQSGDSIATGTAAKTLSITVPGANSGNPQLINFSTDAHAGASESQANIVSFINANLTGATAQFVNNALTITSTATGAAAAVTLANGTAAQTLGLTTAGQSGASLTASGANAQTLSVTVAGANGGNPQLINFSTDAHAGATESEANIISFINANLTGALASFTASGALTITSTATGSAAAVGVNNTSAAQALGLTTAGSANPTTVNGKDETLTQVVSFLNTTAQQALGTSTANAIFSVNGGGNLAIASQTKGVASNISLAAGTGNTASTASIETALGLGNVNGTLGTTGTNASLTSIVNTLNQAFTANTTLQEAGLQASATNGGTTLSVTSSNNTNFRLDEYGTTGTNLGFGNTSGPFTGLTSGVSNASIIDAGGTSAIGNGSIASPYLSFSALQFGSDAQAVTISANSSAGVLQSLTLTLRNDSNPSATESGPQSGATIDSAVSYINAQLQQSNNPTLKGIVAVKENVSGTEQINFLSALPSFSVSVGGSVNGNGLNGGTAQTFGSVANGAATNASIDTVAGALSAVTAVTNAVANLGTAQAAVGIGENQVNYAVNLAQSQITNISAAESQIRDANVAAEAANLTKAQVLVQATVAAMAQANQEPQAILKLLQQ